MLPSKQVPPELADLFGFSTEPAAPVPQEGTPADILEELTPVEAGFIANLAAGMTKGRALIEAGWRGNEAGSSTAANRLSKKPQIKAALAALKASFVANAEYSFEEFNKELDEAKAYAKATKNATAYVRAVELKGKASGHLVDRTENKNLNAGFQIQISGIDNNG